MNQNNVDKTIASVETMLKKLPAGLFLIAGAIVFIMIFFRPWVQVGPGQRGIVLDFGAVQNQVLDEGLHMLIPVMQKVVLMDVKVRLLEHCTLPFLAR